MKTQVLVTIHYMELGGAEMSLLGLLESLDYSKYEVDLFVYSHRGELLRHIPPQVHLLPEIPEYAQVERPLREVVRDGYFRIALARLWAKRRFRGYVRTHHPKDGAAVYSYIANELAPLLPSIRPEKEYDIAVSYLMPHDYVLTKVRAKRKVAWIHTDYSQVEVDAALELPVWAGYDRIVSISPDVTRHFLDVFPSLKDKMVERPNVVPAAYIRSRTGEMTPEDVEEEMPRRPGRIILLSVGRFCYAKNYDNVPDICRRIRQDGVDACWYLVGFGETEVLVRERIAEAGMQEYVRLTGKKDNPYPYMLACDLYVQPSRYEGWPMTVLEARSLGKPVVLTDFPTARGIAAADGGIRIVPTDNEGCARALAEIARGIVKEKTK